MNDMTPVIVPKSDQINTDDLIAGDMTITIAGVSISPGTEQPVSMKIAGSDKVYRPCKSMSRVLVAVWGADANKYVGRSVKLYRDPEVTWGGMKVGGIRIREMSDMDKTVTLALTEKRGSRKVTTIKPMAAAPKPAVPVEPEAMGEDEACALLAEATTLDELQAAWRKIPPAAQTMPEVLAFKDERKGELSAETPF